MIIFRILVTSLLLTIAAIPAHASERIRQFDVALEVSTNGDITVSEKIVVIAEGNQIRRGIFRDLPRYYTRDGIRYRYHYDVQSVTRDGKSEPHERETVGNAMRLRIGDADILLAHGQHTYEIVYRVKNQIRYFDSYDELYWNVTGNYWAFPIDRAAALIKFPDGISIIQQSAFTGQSGDADKSWTYQRRGIDHLYQTTQMLRPGEGLTIALGFNKGVIDPPSQGDRRDWWWQRNGSLAVLIASLFAVLGFYWRGFNKVGRDPVKGPVIVQYEPPEGFSPAAIHHILHRGLRGNKAMIASLLNLAIHKRVTIDAESKTKTVITSSGDGIEPKDGHREEVALENNLFKQKKTITLDGKYDPTVAKANELFQRDIANRFGADFFRWNPVYAVIAIPVTIGAIIFSLVQNPVWTQWHSLAILGLAVVNGLFLYLMPAPTRRGQKIRTHIEGFKLYLETAEKLHLNAVEIASAAQPPMSVERYERFLPYAVALDVEKPWTNYFEKNLPREAEDYQPHWSAHSMRSGHTSLHGLNAALVSGLNSGVTSAMPQSSSSSGSGGGGSSGGGGGGGGGGGW